MAKTAIIIVDMSLKGWWQSTPKLPPLVRREEVRKNVAGVLHVARQNKVPLIFVDDGFQPPEADLEWHLKLFGPHAIDGTEFAETDELIKPDPKTDLVVKKRVYDGFYQTRLDSLLREMEVHDTIFMGTWTDGCLQHTVMGAFFRGYKITVLEDCCSSPYQESHDHAIEYMRKFYGANIARSPEVIPQLATLRANRAT